jgi:uncharacterized cofD-like protein
MTRPGPERITALGGGTGLPAVLGGLRSLVANGQLRTVTAVVAMTDDGGSSGRLRRARGTLPPGDVRNCLVALAAERDLMAGLFQHRYGGSEELGGHTVGNLILVALAEQSGSFLKAVELSGRVLRTAGRILPVTLEDVVLEATLEDGSRVVGETRIGECEKRVKRISLRPQAPRPTPGVVEAIVDADLIVLGPGSLYTSVVPHLAVPDVAEALKTAKAPRVLVANLVSEKGESAGLGLVDHVEIIEAQAGGPIVDAVVVNRSAIDAKTLGRYEAEGTYPLTWPDCGHRDVQVIRRDLLAKGPKLRHDPTATVDGLMAAWRSARAPAGVAHREVGIEADGDGA